VSVDDGPIYPESDVERAIREAHDDLTLAHFEVCNCSALGLVSVECASVRRTIQRSITALVAAVVRETRKIDAAICVAAAPEAHFDIRDTLVADLCDRAIRTAPLPSWAKETK